MSLPSTTNSPGVSRETGGAQEAAWTGALLASPHTVADKATRVNKMFSAIAPSYDLNNRLHSMGMDQHWRNVAVKMGEVKETDMIVDVACGTGDLTIKFAEKLLRLRGKKRHRLIENSSYTFGFEEAQPAVIGVDFTYEMLPIAQSKGPRLRWQRYLSGGGHGHGSEDAIQWINGNALALPLPDQSADILSIAFGIRNVADWGAAIDEFARVLKPGGRLIILEFSLPTNAMLRAFYNFYFRKIMPLTATLISGDKSGAYKYLPESVNTFITRQVMQDRMKTAGFQEIVARPMTLGICVCYRGIKQ